MKEAVWVEIAGKRTGAVLDRKAGRLWVDKPSREFDHVVATTYEGETYTITYAPEPSRCSCGCCDPMYPNCCC